MKNSSATATWVSAISTFAATFAALYLGLHHSPPPEPALSGKIIAVTYAPFGNHRFLDSNLHYVSKKGMDYIFGITVCSHNADLPIDSVYGRMSFNSGTFDAVPYWITKQFVLHAQGVLDTTRYLRSLLPSDYDTYEIPFEDNIPSMLELPRDKIVRGYISLFVDAVDSGKWNTLTLYFRRHEGKVDSLHFERSAIDWKNIYPSWDIRKIATANEFAKVDTALLDRNSKVLLSKLKSTDK